MPWLCADEGRREAAAERGGVGEQVRFVKALLIRREEVVPVVAAADERVERLRLTSRDARPGHIASVDIGEGAVGTVKAVAEVRIEVKVTNQRAVGGVRSEIEAEVGADIPADRIAIEDRILLVGDNGPPGRAAPGATTTPPRPWPRKPPTLIGTPVPLDIYLVQPREATARPSIQHRDAKAINCDHRVRRDRRVESRAKDSEVDRVGAAHIEGIRRDYPGVVLRVN